MKDGNYTIEIDLTEGIIRVYEEVWVEEEIIQPEITNVSEDGVVTFIGTGTDKAHLPFSEYAEVGPQKIIKTGHFENRLIGSEKL